MGLFREVARQYLFHRMTSGRRRRGSGLYGPMSGSGRRRSPSPWGYSTRSPYARRGRSQKRVVGCCLPIPLALTLGAFAGLARLFTR